MVSYVLVWNRLWESGYHCVFSLSVWNGPLQEGRCVNVAWHSGIRDAQ